MEIIVSYYTDAGNVKKVNQDSLSVKVVNSPKGKVAFAVVCDGMGGLEHGEIASKEVVLAFSTWFETEFANMFAREEVSVQEIYEQWRQLVKGINEKLSKQASVDGALMGTTASVLLIYEDGYCLCHVGDSRIYEIHNSVQQLTQDQTLVAMEVEMGNLTKEEALVDPRRSILLQCVGASEVVEPQLETGRIEYDTTFLLCSDGFVHKIEPKELYDWFSPNHVWNKSILTETCKKAVELVEQRGEQDNITVVAIVMQE